MHRQARPHLHRIEILPNNAFVRVSFRLKNETWQYFVPLRQNPRLKAITRFDFPEQAIYATLTL